MRVQKITTILVLTSVASIGFASSAMHFFQVNNGKQKKAKTSLRTAQVTSSRNSYDPGYGCWVGVDDGYDDWYTEKGVCFSSSLAIAQDMQIAYTCHSTDAPAPLVCDGRSHYLLSPEESKSTVVNGFFRDADGTVVASGLSDEDYPDIPAFTPLKLSVTVSINNCKINFNEVLSMKGGPLPKSVAGKAFNCIGGDATKFTEIPR